MKGCSSRALHQEFPKLKTQMSTLWTNSYFVIRLFACFGVTLTVLEPGEEKTPEQELTDDLLALIASFSGRLYGMRSHKQKELLKCAQAVIQSP
jgi:predicted site-specific integrase-resolvase